MHRFIWVVCAAFLCVPTRARSTQTVSMMEVRLLRVEGAAAGVRRSAERLAVILKKTSDSGRLSDIPAVRTELTDLHRMVVSARMAVTVAIEELRADPPVK